MSQSRNLDQLGKNLHVLVEICGLGSREPDDIRFSGKMDLNISYDLIVGVPRGDINPKVWGMKSFRRHALAS